MAINFRLPTINADSALLLNTPVAANDVLLANGVLSVLDESGATALVIKATDFLNFNYSAYTVGTASIEEIDLSLVTIVNNGVYALTISAPYVVNFFGGGQETGAVYQARTYTVSLDATATTQELLDAFLARINADTFAYFTAADLGGNILEITANAPGFGPLNIVAPTGSVVSTSVAWVEPVGSVNEVLQYIPNVALVTGTYDRYVITYRRVIRHNIVNGMQVIRPVQAIVYLNSGDAGTAATVTKLTNILDGSYTPVADYLGCPQV